MGRLIKHTVRLVFQDTIYIEEASFPDGLPKASFPRLPGLGLGQAGFRFPK